MSKVNSQQMIKVNKVKVVINMLGIIIILLSFSALASQQMPTAKGEFISISKKAGTARSQVAPDDHRLLRLRPEAMITVKAAPVRPTHEAELIAAAAPLIFNNNNNKQEKINYQQLFNMDPHPKWVDACYTKKPRDEVSNMFIGLRLDDPPEVIEADGKRAIAIMAKIRQRHQAEGQVLDEGQSTTEKPVGDDMVIKRRKRSIKITGTKHSAENSFILVEEQHQQQKHIDSKLRNVAGQMEKQLHHNKLSYVKRKKTSFIGHSLAKKYFGSNKIRHFVSMPSDVSATKTNTGATSFMGSSVAIKVPVLFTEQQELALPFTSQMHINDVKIFFNLNQAFLTLFQVQDIVENLNRTLNEELHELLAREQNHQVTTNNIEREKQLLVENQRKWLPDSNLLIIKREASISESAPSIALDTRHVLTNLSHHVQFFSAAIEQSLADRKPAQHPIDYTTKPTPEQQRLQTIIKLFQQLDYATLKLLCDIERLTEFYDDLNLNKIGLLKHLANETLIANDNQNRLQVVRDALMSPGLTAAKNLKALNSTYIYRTDKRLKYWADSIESPYYWLLANNKATSYTYTTESVKFIPREVIPVTERMKFYNASNVERNLRDQILLQSYDQFLINLNNIMTKFCVK